MQNPTDVIDRAVAQMREADLDEQMRATAALLASASGLIKEARITPIPLGVLPHRALRLAEIMLGESADAPR